MGKKIRSEMQKQASIFVEGCTERGIDKAQAEAIFELLERFADYGFNKSHAAAYALVAYQTAYMKANYPVEFLAASMTLDMGNTDKLSEFRAEAERIGIKVDPPSINRSDVAFEVDGNTIIYALAALKGVGREAVKSIIAARANGPFADLADFAARINPRAVNKRVLESLAQAGASMNSTRTAPAFWRRSRRSWASPSARMRREAVGQNDFFGGGGKAEPIALPQVEPWLPAEKLRREYDAIGFFLSGHPLDDYTAVLKKLRVQSWAEFSRAVKNGATAGKVAGTVVSRQERRTKTGNKMGIFGLSDPTGHYEAVIFSEGLAEYRDLLEPGTAVLLVLSAEVQGDDVRARIQSAEPLDAAAANMQKGLRVFLRDGAPLDGVAKRLEKSAPRSGGDGEVSVVLMLRAGHRGRGQAAGPLQGLAADRRRHQGGARALSRSRRCSRVRCRALPIGLIAPSILRATTCSARKGRRSRWSNMAAMPARIAAPPMTASPRCATNSASACATCFVTARSPAAISRAAPPNWSSTATIPSSSGMSISLLMTRSETLTEDDLRVAALELGLSQQDLDAEADARQARQGARRRRHRQRARQRRHDHADLLHQQPPL